MPARELPPALRLDHLPRMILTADGWMDRPEIAAPTVTLGPEGAVVTRPELPEGTRLHVVECGTGEVLYDGAAGADLALTLADVGVYRLTLTPPLPWLAREIVVEVPAC